MKNFLHAFTQFLQRSPTPWHAARETFDLLVEADFIPLVEGEKWDLKGGNGYVVAREDTAICAFRLPESVAEKALILGSHLDSPALKLKPNADFCSHGLCQFATEVYGSPLLHTWLDREIAIAGRIVVKTDSDSTSSHLIFLDDYPFIIPQLPIHLNRSIKESGFTLNRQTDLNPLVSSSEEVSLESLLRKHLHFDELLSSDLFLVPIQPPGFLGVENEWMCGYRLDNLCSVFASLEALITAKSSSLLQMAVFWDHEEVGSSTHLGAESSFLNEILERISLCLHNNPEHLYRLKSKSLCASIDLAHGYHPNYPDRFDPRNTPYLGKGVVLKHNAQQRYATNALTAIPLMDIAKQKGLPLQHFAMRSDIPSGSTVGPIMARITGIPTVDLGIASWSMHSTRETIASNDLFSLFQLLQALLEKENLFR